ncbi:MAG: RNA methyltransferase, partial [Rhodospirillales bacterium]|nr:RNA methyltransferase [Rhodospirillales bacterium]
GQPEQRRIDPLGHEAADQRRLGVPVSKVSPEAFRSISTTDRASGVAAVVRQDVATLDCVDPIGTMFWIVLESVRSSGNLGTLLRTSAAVGGSGFIMLSKQIDPYNPAVVRSSMGALFRQRYVRTDLRQLWHWVRDHHLQLIGVSPGGDTCFTKPMYHRPTLIALGNERTGLSESVADRCHATVRIPMLPETDSLNLGAAGALMMYEVARKNGTFERLNQPEARGSAGRRPP